MIVFYWAFWVPEVVYFEFCIRQQVEEPVTQRYVTEPWEHTFYDVYQPEFELRYVEEHRWVYQMGEDAQKEAVP